MHLSEAMAKDGTYWANDVCPVIVESGRFPEMNGQTQPSITELSVCKEPLCPLNRVRSGIAVRVKQLCASPEVGQRLREIGMVEEQIVKLLSCGTNVICIVCNARLALSTQLAETILVEPLEPALA